MAMGVNGPDQVTKPSKKPAIGMVEPDTKATANNIETDKPSTHTEPTPLEGITRREEARRSLLAYGPLPSNTAKRSRADRKKDLRAKKQKTGRDTGYQQAISSEPRSHPALLHLDKKVSEFDLYPEISKEIEEKQVQKDKLIVESEEEEEEKPRNGTDDPPKLRGFPREPTEEEHISALKQVDDTVKLEGIDEGDDIMAAIGWSKENKDHLEIIDEFQNKEAIQANQTGYLKLMEGSGRAGRILWDKFQTLGDVAANKTRKHMTQTSSTDHHRSKAEETTQQPSCGLSRRTNLAFPWTNLYDHQDPSTDENVDVPLSFGMIIPSFKSNGKIGLEADGHRIDNGNFVFPDIQISVNFPPDTICSIIFRAHQYRYTTLKSTPFGDSSRLGICIQAPPSKLNENTQFPSVSDQKPGNVIN
ncbi:hypothetical protein PSTG_13503 [Puccinia striiformis f. sp. tritici PST-78]|uniref:Tet-like 2OG-Fe(II) oxygenase domain-containing protein n=1 Tax=Puccinia striiformis f. sp. tritici PST-78 TaxID=1165861 RepID=A0A0L0V2B5_9BASI|nr:hypothetical protein PSTG_13503 [Puccinia striiformis f. sp. tritici PST-78]